MTEGGFDALLQSPAVGGLELLLHACERLHIRVLTGAEQAVVLLNQFAGARQTRCDHLIDTSLIGFRQGLSQADDVDAGAHPSLAIVDL